VHQLRRLWGSIHSTVRSVHPLTCPLTAAYYDPDQPVGPVIRCSATTIGDVMPITGTSIGDIDIAIGTSEFTRAELMLIARVADELGVGTVFLTEGPGRDPF